jgi:CelD/BcsL family acetyltransferase involved in cellulose biosynthesis
MRVHTIRPAELGKGEIELWHQIQLTSPWFGNPFLSPEFSIAVGRFRPDSRIGVLMDGQRIAGFFPFEQRGFGVGVPLSGWVSGCQGVVHLPDAAWDAVGLVKGCGLAAWKFDNLIPDQKPFERYLSGTGQAPIIDVSGGFESYYAKVHARAHQFCRELERKSRKLSREVGEVHMVVETADRKPLRQLMAWKSDQYRRSNRFDRFNEPWMQGLLEELLATQTPHLSGLASIVYAGTEPVSIQFGLRAGKLCEGWFTAYDLRFSKYSPGMLQIRYLAESLAGIGITEIRMGKGASPYTEAMKSHDLFVGEGTVYTRSPLGIAQVARSVSRQRVLDTLQAHPGLRRGAGQVLRRTGISSRLRDRI